jgi:hypothetical protein
MPAAPWRVTEVTVLGHFRLRLRFNDATEGIADLSALVRAPNAGVFAALAEAAVFAQATVDPGAVTWPTGADLAPDALYDAIRESGVWHSAP